MGVFRGSHTTQNISCQTKLSILYPGQIDDGTDARDRNREDNQITINQIFFAGVHIRRTKSNCILLDFFHASAGSY